MRRQDGVRLAPRHRGRRLAVILGIAAFPAFAGAADWEPFKPAAPTQEQAPQVTPMPFEIPGQSFPGSAFYYLADEPQLAYDFEQVDTNLFDISGTGSIEAVEQLVEARAGPAARAFGGGGSGLDKARALQCLTQAIYYEAASEAVGGQRAVAQVVLNRVAHPSYPRNVCGVVFQGSERRTGCQFSFTCDGSLKRKASVTAWARARMVARDALGGQVYAPVGLATHYHTIWIYPYWAPSLHPVGTIGAHRFYRWRGSAGKPAAFTASYSGNEPAAAPKPRAPSADDTPPAADPLSLARAYEEARKKAEREGASQRGRPTAARQPAPDYAPAIRARGGDAVFTAQDLPEASGIKPEYANSGRWLREPGRPRAPADTAQDSAGQNAAGGL